MQLSGEAVVADWGIPAQEEVKGGSPGPTAAVCPVTGARADASAAAPTASRECPVTGTRLEEQKTLTATNGGVPPSHTTPDRNSGSSGSHPISWHVPIFLSTRNRADRASSLMCCRCAVEWVSRPGAAESRYPRSFEY